MDLSDGAVIAQWESEVASREEVLGPVRVLVKDAPVIGLDVAPPGSILVAWSDDDKALSAVEHAFGDAPRLQKALLGGIQNLVLPENPGIEEIFAAMRAFAAVRYAGRTLLNPVTLPPARGAVSYTVVPWLGSPLDPGLFGSTSWVQPGAKPLAVLVLANPPIEDPGERALLAALPADVNTDLLARQDSYARAATFVAKAAATWAVGKATDAGAEKVRQWAKANAREAQRDRAQAQELARLKQQAARHQWRNASIVAQDPLGVESSPLPPGGLTVEELIQRRVNALKGEHPGGEA